MAVRQAGWGGGGIGLLRYEWQASAKSVMCVYLLKSTFSEATKMVQFKDDPFQRYRYEAVDTVLAKKIVLGFAEPQVGYRMQHAGQMDFQLTVV